MGKRDRKRELERTNGLNISVGKQTRVETNSGFSRSIGQGSVLNLASTRNSNRVKYTASGTPRLTKRGEGDAVFRRGSSMLLSVQSSPSI